MKFSAAVVLAAAIGASAAPSHGHAHAHRHAHRSVEAREFVMAKKPAPPAPAPETTTPPPPPPATSTPEPAPASTEAPAAPPVAAAAAAVDVDTSSSASSSSSSSSSSSASTPSSSSSGGVAKPFCNGKTKRATLAQIAYAGNVGGTGKDYGCNMMEIDADTASAYDYTVKFVNKGDDEQECKVWNKIGDSGGINGFFSGNEVLTFKLPVGGQQYIAVEGNSQIGASCGSGSVPVTSFGQFAGTWFEGDFANESNQKYSGFDASALVSGKYGLNIPPMKVCGDGTCSTIFQGGTGDNAYVPGMEDVDGTGGNVPPGPLHVTVSVNGL